MVLDGLKVVANRMHYFSGPEDLHFYPTVPSATLFLPQFCALLDPVCES